MGASILGISGSPIKNSNTDRLVQAMLKETGCETEFIKLSDINVRPCMGCKQCVTDNICKVEDDLTPLREKIVAADAFVFGAPNYYTSLNATTHALLERWFQFRHQTGDTLWGKLAVVVGVGGTSGRFPADELEKFFLYNFIETVAKVTGQGALSTS